MSNSEDIIQSNAKKGFRCEMTVPYQHLAGRWSPTEAASDVVDDNPFRGQHPAAPTLGMTATLMEHARSLLFTGTQSWYTGLKTFAKSQDIIFFPDYYRTIKEFEKLTILIHAVHTGISSQQSLYRLMNSSGNIVGLALFTAVSVENGMVKAIPDDSILRKIPQKDLYDQYLKDLPPVKFEHYSKRDVFSEFDFELPIQIRSSDIDVWMHVNHALFLYFAMDTIDAAIFDGRKNNSSKSWFMTLNRLCSGAFEGAHNVKWSRVFVSYDDQAKFGDNLSCRFKVLDDAVELVVVKWTRPGEGKASARIKCWHPKSNPINLARL